ncbi:GntR family transcriptional regulator [Microbacterium yannicii]|nr:GntR family transcriptional regulator [Microbacterium yannicii]MCO5954800.1 GntR family transcriptional regulator [Microbacterium yannicii]
MDQLPSLGSSARVMLGDEIYAVLQQAIMDGTIPPDARVNAGELARRFDVSPTPIREALARLESDGLVEKHPLKGYRTTDLLAREELVDLFELRLLLEPGTAARAAQRRRPAEAQDLLAEIDLAQVAVGQSDAYATLSQHDVRLHDKVFRAAHNDTVRLAYARTHCHLHTFRLAYTGSYVADTVAEHAAIAEAIAASDPAGAESAMRTHVERSMERLLRVFD